MEHRNPTGNGPRKSKRQGTSLLPILGRMLTGTLNLISVVTKRGTLSLFTDKQVNPTRIASGVTFMFYTVLKTVGAQFGNKLTMSLDEFLAEMPCATTDEPNRVAPINRLTGVITVSRDFNLYSGGSIVAILTDKAIEIATMLGWTNFNTEAARAELGRAFVTEWTNLKVTINNPELRPPVNGTTGVETPALTAIGFWSHQVAGTAHADAYLQVLRGTTRNATPTRELAGVGGSTPRTRN